MHIILFFIKTKIFESNPVNIQIYKQYASIKKKLNIELYVELTK